MGQGIVRRNKPQTTQSQPKPKPKPTPKPKPAPEAAGYDVTFTCNVSSATLYIDGNANGNTSGTRFLKTGTHRIKATADGYKDYEGSLNVNSQNKSCKIMLEKKPIVATYQNGILNVKGVSYRMVEVRGGTFQMGATSEQGSDAYSSEMPAHEVTLTNGYYLGETEVTQALWEAVMGSNPSYFKGSNRPVENVSWNDCQEFLSKLNGFTGKHFRLPTEAEWEFAARGGNKSKGYKYSGSSNLGDVAWYGDNSGDETHPVKTKSPNELGLYDMSGNVWEWCQDRYGEEYYMDSPQTNPTGPSSGSNRVNRGGSWSNYATNCRVANRINDTPSIRSSYIGFRLALSSE